MKPIKLYLRNHIGVRSGMGRDEIELDLERLAGDGRLVAITGPNGIGKTTVLDSLTPYRLLAFRAGGYSPGSFSYYDHLYGTSAEKRLVWEHRGERYQSIMVFKMPGKTRTTEAYLQIETPDGWAPYSAPDGTLSDGKSSTYDTCVNAVMGTPEMFYTSAFSAQARRQLSDYGNGEIKDLLSELLGLEEIVEKGRVAADTSKALRARHDALSQSLRRADEAREERVMRAQEAKAADEALAAARRARDGANTELHAAQGALAKAQSDGVAVAEARQKRAALNEQLAALENRRTELLRQIETDTQTTVSQLDAHASSLKGELARVDKAIADAQETIRNATRMIERAEDIKRACERQQALSEEIAAAETREGELEEAVSAHQALATEIEAKTAALAGIKRDGESASRHEQDLRARSALVDNVPCAGTDLQPRCELLAEANTARAKLPEATATVEAKRREYREAQEAIRALQERASQSQASVEERGQMRERLRALRNELRECQNLASLAGRLEDASAAKAAATQALSESETRKGEIATELEGIAERVQQARAQGAQRREGAETDIGAQRNAIEREIAALPPEDAEQAITAAQARVAQAEKVAADREADVERATQNRATATARVQTLDDEIASLAETERHARHLESEIAHWTTLSKALSRDGIVSLCIDDAGPQLSAIANDLLTACYGPRYTLRIDTQRATAKGTMKEDFDIVVFDGKRDDEKSVRRTSGGERIWINEALTRAIALYRAQQSGEGYSCLFADESDGALDADRKHAFMAMKRRVLELGGYEQEFFITHTPELWDLADVRIDLEQFVVEGAPEREEAA